MGHDKDHAGEHTDGIDDIQDATDSQKGLATSSQITKLDGVGTGATKSTFAEQSNVYFISDDKGNNGYDGSMFAPVKDHAAAVTLGQAAGLNNIILITDGGKTKQYPDFSVPDGVAVDLGAWEGVWGLSVYIDKVTLGDGSTLSVNDHRINTIKISATCTSCDVYLEESNVGRFRDFAETGYPTVMYVETYELRGDSDTLADLINIRDSGAGWYGSMLNYDDGVIYAAFGFAPNIIIEEDNTSTSNPGTTPVEAKFWTKTLKPGKYILNYSCELQGAGSINTACLAEFDIDGSGVSFWVNHMTDYDGKSGQKELVVPSEASYRFAFWFYKRSVATGTVFINSMRLTITKVVE